jgi:CheY-like chemotaxis protein
MNRIQPYVLVVDDLHDAADSMAELLTLWGYEAEARYCGCSALAAVRERRPAVVLLDIGMAPMSGFTFAAEFREVPGCERTAVVAISGYTSEAYQARCRELGINQYLFKPADLNLLRAILSLLPPEPEPMRSRTEYRHQKSQHFADVCEVR